MTIGIYSIVNKVNQKRYIGLSIELENRVRNHKWHLRNNIHKNPHLQNSWNKYGESQFDVEILETFKNINSEELVEKEKEYIAYYDSFQNGYNRSLGGDGQIGFVADEGRLKRMSEAMKGNQHALGRVASATERKNKSDAFKKRTDHAEHSERGRQTLKNLWKEESFRINQFAMHMGNQYAKGIKRSEEFKKNLSVKRKGKLNPFYNKKHSEKTLKELSRISKERWKDEEYRNKVLPKRRKMMNSREYKETMSKAMRGEGNGKSKATEREAIDIKLKYLNGMKLREIITHYPQYSKSGLQKIYLGLTWKYLPGTIEELELMLINYQSTNESGGRSND